jgi:hypothetical protein
MRNLIKSYKKPLNLKAILKKTFGTCQIITKKWELKMRVISLKD